MAFILSIETATTACSVALHTDGELILDIKKLQEKSHSEDMMQMVQDLLKTSKIGTSELDAVAISGGPGSYTGLRIGVSSAKGLCFGLNIPLIAINTLEVMVDQISDTRGIDYLCPMLDARRMEVYCLLADKSSKIISPTEAKVIGERAFEEILKKSKILFFGSGAEKCKGVINSPNAQFLDDIHPMAESVGHLAFKKFQLEDFEDIISYEPMYLKPVNITKPRKQIL
jgi:tRNA threonylcarbamoyladenosine biosynthesis protein TsaB